MLLSRYPTEKAYGVTTRHTAQALRNLGHTVDIFSPNQPYFEGEDRAPVIIKSLFTHFSKLSSANSLIATFQFFFVSILWLFYVKSFLRLNRYDLIWSRHLLVPTFLRNMGLNFTEIHNELSAFEILFVKFFSCKNLMLGPISPMLMKLCQIQFGERFRLIYSPMSAPDTFFKKPKSKFNSHRISMAYVGRYKSIGKDQGIDNLIRNYLFARSNLDSKLMLTLVGISERELEEIATNLTIPLLTLKQANIRAIANVDHHLIPRVMNRVDIALIPYSEDPRFHGRFPIKIMEYAAMGIPMLCANASYLQSLPLNKYVWFYESDNPNSFVDVLQSILSSSAAAHKMACDAQNFAREFDYSSRAKRVLDVICLKH